MKLSLYNILNEDIDINDIEFNYASYEEMNPPKTVRCIFCDVPINEYDACSCETCDQYPFCESCYEMHVWQHDQCDYCGIALEYEEDEDEGYYSCYVCNKRFCSDNCRIQHRCIGN